MGELEADYDFSLQYASCRLLFSVQLQYVFSLCIKLDGRWLVDYIKEPADPGSTDSLL